MDNWCCICIRNGGNVPHLIHSLFIGLLWSLLFALFGMTWVLDGDVVVVLSCWRGGGAGTWETKQEGSVSWTILFYVVDFDTM